MKKEIMEKWVAALRSGKYKQGKRKLKSKSMKTPKSSYSYCCLGVLCELYSKEHFIQINKIVDDTLNQKNIVFDEQENVLPAKVKIWAGCVDSNPSIPYNGFESTLAQLNDSGVNFKQIADAIEKNYNWL